MKSRFLPTPFVNPQIVIEDHAEEQLIRNLFFRRRRHRLFPPPPVSENDFPSRIVSRTFGPFN